MEKVGACPIMQELRVGVCGTGAFQSISRFKTNKNVLRVGLNLLLQCAVEVSRGQKEIRPIHGKIGPSVAIKNPGPDATAGSGSCPSADCQSRGTAASVYPPPFLYGFPKHPLLLLGETNTRSSYLD